MCSKVMKFFYIHFLLTLFAFFAEYPFEHDNKNE